MSADSTETIGRALVIGAVAVVAATASNTVVVASSIAAAFCLGRWMYKLRR